MTELDVLPSDVAELLRAYREPLAVEPAQAEAAERRLQLALTAAQVLSASAIAATVAHASIWAKLGAFLTRKGSIAIAMLGLGAGAGAYLQSELGLVARPAVSDFQVLTASSTTTVPSVRIIEPLPSTLASSAVAPAQDRALPSPPASAGAKSSQLAEERALLEMGRTALARGQHQDALAAARNHERAYPNGKLGEEREVLLVQALASSGQKEAAQTRATRFVRMYPHSIFVSAVRAAVEP